MQSETTLKELTLYFQLEFGPQMALLQIIISVAPARMQGWCQSIPGTSVCLAGRFSHPRSLAGLLVGTQFLTNVDSSK